jgi:hypothetical protein
VHFVDAHVEKGVIVLNRGYSLASFRTPLWLAELEVNMSHEGLLRGKDNMVHR